jgi:HK97 family phage major capsid protein
VGAQNGLDDEFDSPAAFFKAINHDPNIGDMGKRNKIKNALGSTVGADGGYLIPEIMRADLLQLAMESAIVRPRAFVMPMESLRVSIPSIDETSRATSVFGGITASWTEEGAPLTVTSPSFARTTLEAKKLTIYTEVPNELLSDSMISFDAFIGQKFPQALAWYEDIAFLQGNGVGQPVGALASASNSAIVAAAAETGQNTGTIVWENIVKMFSRMLPASLGSAVWIASIDTFPQLATMALSVGTGGSAIWLGDGVGAPPVSILGRPVIFTEKTSQLSTQGDISFVDFGYYLVGDRMAMTAMSSPHYKFGNDVTAYRVIERVDGRPWLQSSLTPRNSGPALSPFVQLATR